MTCEICRYYGYDFRVVENMDHITFTTLYNGMTQLKAREMLNDFTIADYPYINDKRAKKSLHRKVYKIGYPKNFEQRIVKTTDLELF